MAPNSIQKILASTLILSSLIFAGSWDNELYIGNKINGIVKDWRFSGDIQIRLKDDYQALNYLYVETAATWMFDKHWELSPDFRFTLKPTRREYRPGLGIIRKDLFNENGNIIAHQIVNQIKYQADFYKDNVSSAVRYAIFYNMAINKKVIPNVGVGVLYRWADHYSGPEFVRGGGGVAIVFDQIHTMNFSYFLSATHDEPKWTYSGIFMLQLIFNINRNYKYIPAKYLGM